MLILVFESKFATELLTWIWHSVCNSPMSSWWRNTKFQACCSKSIRKLFVLVKKIPNYQKGRQIFPFLEWVDLSLFECVFVPNYIFFYENIKSKIRNLILISSKVIRSQSYTSYSRKNIGICNIIKHVAKFVQKLISKVLTFLGCSQFDPNDLSGNSNVNRKADDAVFWGPF